MRRIITTLAVVLGFSLPFIGGCLSFGGNAAKSDKPETTTKVEKNTTTNTRTETETTRP